MLQKEKTVYENRSIFYAVFSIVKWEMACFIKFSLTCLIISHNLNIASYYVEKYGIMYLKRYMNSDRAEVIEL